MNRFRTFLAVLALPTALIISAASSASADDAPGGDSTSAVAVNTEDGASLFRLAFSIRQVADGLVDQDNSAYALASCADCQTVALAFQVVLVNGDADTVVPENRAVAYNDECVDCLTYASATQVILGYDGPVRFTADGRRRLHALRQSLLELETRIAELSPAELQASVSAAKAELLAILDEELVEAGSAATGPDEPATTTSLPSTTTTTAGSTTTAPTTSTSSTATSSTSTTSSSTTTSTEPTTTTTTTAPVTSTTESTPTTEG